MQANPGGKCLQVHFGARSISEPQLNRQYIMKNRTFVNFRLESFLICTSIYKKNINPENWVDPEILSRRKKITNIDLCAALKTIKKLAFSWFSLVFMVFACFVIILWGLMIYWAPYTYFGFFLLQNISYMHSKLCCRHAVKKSSRFGNFIPEKKKSQR